MQEKYELQWKPADFSCLSLVYFPLSALLILPLHRYNADEAAL